MKPFNPRFLAALSALNLIGLAACSGKVIVNEPRRPADELVPGDDNGTTGACNDGIQNGTETGVDCGGGCPAKCGNGSGCAVDGDCQSNSCNGTTCMPAACGDGRQNGFETSVDCGGPECVACGTGSSCTLPSDCTSHVCNPATGQCAAASCTDGVMNGDETGVDCGGACADLTPAKTCATGHGCTTDDDCATHVCQEGICRVDTCKNGFKDGDEVGVDCGGPKCGRCDVGKECETGSDCLSGVCLSFQCQAGTCTDGVKNQDESDVDCGGSCPADCLDGGTCNANTDCASNLCVTDRCRPTGCTNGVQDGNETGVDCGGPCAACGTGGGCTGAADCTSGVCTGLVCQAPTCSDGVKNGDETGIDCGYLACSVSCGVGGGCENDYDCTTHACDLVTHRCLSPTCTDGRRNGDETGVDCGGSECSGCGTGSNCQNPGDCASGVCTGGTCQPPTCTDTVLNGDETGTDCGGSCALNEGLTCPAGGGCLIEEDCSSPLLCLEGTCSPATCTNTAIDPPNGETDVDCGGTECPACANGKHCGVNRDCQSQVCGVGASCASPPCTCQAPSCVDGVKNGDEVDVDCGYVACGGGCDVGDVCARDQDCQSLVCATGRCQEPSCFDTVQNGNETGPDCGGACVAVEGFTCPDLSGCLNASDCESGVCTGGVCQHPSCAPTDGVKNGNETGIDCGGGGGCPTCGNGTGCRTNGDCTSGVCSGLICQVPRCSPPDGVQNGTETDTDCGGAGCPKCADTKKCSVGGDCVSDFCGSNGRCQPAGCNDTVKNGSETDVDCGGSVCSKCDVAGHCLVPGDCLTGVCTNGTSPTCTGGGPCCQSPSCSDTVKNGDEGDVDCGGAISGCRRCNPGEHCNLAADCASGVCTGGICQAPRCGDGVKNASEICDDGNTLDCLGNGTIFCKHDCTALIVITGCGDGYVCGTEECDDANGNDLDNCRNTCEQAFCGDGVVSTAATGGFHEDCDDGTNDGSYGTCMPGCTVAPFCGDGHVDAPNETCDDSVNDGSYGTCRPNCRLAPYCGDGKVSTPPEACDDGGTSSGDGCSANCTAVEATYFCPTPGAPCLKACGNGRFDTGEVCDDGGKCTNGNACTIGGPACSDASPCVAKSSDGCSTTCQVETGWTCPRFGQACHLLCGNGVLDGGELCDDGGLCNNNTTRCSSDATCKAINAAWTCTTRSNDGCRADCALVEATWECPVVGAPCNKICGNGRVDLGEACDNGVLNQDNLYNGCNLNCTLGPRCGDATVNAANGEQCDLGTSNNNGAYGGCRSDCTKSVRCGDGTLTSPPEVCDDAGLCNDNTTRCTSDATCKAINAAWTCTTRAGDGCAVDCRSVEAGFECLLVGQPCTLTCGNGRFNPGEICDDGNRTGSDGCAANCLSIDSGYACPTYGQPCVKTCGNGQLDLGEACDDRGRCNDNTTSCTSDAVCKALNAAWTCTPRSGDGCRADCGLVEAGWECPTVGLPCNLKCGNGTVNLGEACDLGAANQNGLYNGCSTTCTWGPRCGDGTANPGFEECDLGVTNNHGAYDGCRANCTWSPHCGDGIISLSETCEDSGKCNDGTTTCHADATCRALPGADTTWKCVGRAGDGCSAGCQTEAGWVCRTLGQPCQLLSDCGNGVVSGSEACDDGKRCSNGTACTLDSQCPSGTCIPRSGDGCDATCSTIESGWSCPTPGAACVAALCGDGLVRGNEECDDANLVDTDNCRNNCRRPSCGDAVASIDATGAYHEECDVPPNLAVYNGCMAGCFIAPHCGDSIRQPAYEECDNGTNNGAYGTCYANCKRALHCGDGVLTAPPEVCDDGGLCDDNTTHCLKDADCTTGLKQCTARNSDGCSADCTAIGAGYECTTPGSACTLKCGNGAYNSGEACDDSNRTGGDGCSADCGTVEAGYRCPTYGQPCVRICGNGQLDSGEACDDGQKRCDDNVTPCANDAACKLINPAWVCRAKSLDGCLADCSAVESGWECLTVGAPCRLKCGNGHIDGTEACDFGDGATPPHNVDNQYNGCNTNCTWGPHCGDTIVQASQGEECDLGTLGNTGGYGGCRSDCTWSPHCGDGTKIPPETCEDGGKCDNNTTVCTSDPVCQATNNTWRCSGQPGDGCNASCQVESGWICRNVNQACQQTSDCGNGAMTGSEKCDDAGLCNDNVTRCRSTAYCALANASWTCTPRSGDGCDSTCSTVAPGWTCPVPGKPCTAIACGDGFQAGFEECDDGNTNNGDGCSSTCKRETATCGNGIVEGAEECDDHNIGAGDGCSAACKLEAGYACFGTRGVLCGPASGQGNCPCSAKAQVCGDGAREVAEECDDGKHCGDVDHTRCTADTQCQSLLNTCASRCGNGACEKGECASCPADCSASCTGAGANQCGNTTCDAGETAATCPSDCGSMHCGDTTFKACTSDGDCPAAAASYPCVPRAGDGCGPTCKVEPMFECIPDGLGTYCRPTCGDGKTLVAVGEQCDDGNTVSGDGCSSACTIEPGWSCTDFTNPRYVDIPLAVYDFRGRTEKSLTSGSGYLTTERRCADNSTTCANDAACAGQTRYCPNSTTTCTSDANCNGAGAKTCGDGTACSTDNDCFGKGVGRLCGDGTTTCTVDANCTAGQRECSDGYDCPSGYNCAANGHTGTCIRRCLERCVTRCDSARCWYWGHPDFEQAGICGNYTGLVQPRTASDSTPTYAPFRCTNTATACAVNADCTPNTCTSATACIASATSFAPWYHDSAGVNSKVERTIHLQQRVELDPSGRTYVYDSYAYSQGNDGGFFLLNHCADGFVCAADADCAWSHNIFCKGYHGNAGTYACTGNKCPDGKACNVAADCQGRCGDGTTVCTAASDCVAHNTGGCVNNYCLDGYPCTQSSDCLGTHGGTCTVDGFGNMTGQSRNFLFTSEFHTYFQYRGGETLSFTGDDDVWVFINGVLAVDIGGVHGASAGSVTLSSTVDPTLKIVTDNRFNIYEKGLYAIDFFNAERHTTQSNYKLTLAGFLSTGTATCRGICGNGIAQAGEQCDDGNAIDTDSCHNNCTLNGPSSGVCGNQALDAGEQCDDGNSVNTDYCTNSCKLPVCGDGFKQVVAGEFCDDGGLNGTYGHCALGCQAMGPYCGDGITNGSEVCDDGVNNGAYGTCMVGCTGLASYCGDGIVDLGHEQCDEGTGPGKNTGIAPSRCRPNCTSTATCGDSIIDAFLGEVCDDGALNGTYNHCALGCQAQGPYCGDGIPNGAEVCDDGVNVGGYGKCKPGCTQLDIYCGDAIKNGPEQCDLGTALNTGSYGGCNPSCTRAAYCGDGVFNPPDEKCDDGTNIGTYGGCMAGCQARAPYCGDSIVNGAEVCDDGVNVGTYGGCMPGCGARAPYCGDGVTNGAEVCDDGALNGTYNHCAAGCLALGPYCGDGIVNGAEVCDDGVNVGGYGKCKPGCAQRDIYCGDAVINGAEQCDNGTALNDGRHNGCNSNCTRAPWCGDGTVNPPSEECDDGTHNQDGTYGDCQTNCTLGPRCGDAVLDTRFEECDAGDANNDGLAPERCNADCTSNAICGDGFVDPMLGEQCDNGAANNNTLYGGCRTDCQLGPRCGDAIVNGSEVCDDGVNNDAYGSCVPGCGQRAAHCGDGTTSGPEQCDNGVLNDGRYGGCNPNCTRAPYCGDSVFNPPNEQCDNGPANVNNVYGACQTNCTLGPRCGDSITNGAEVCDDGTNSGSYGGCMPGCLARGPRCGDSVLDAGFEDCDFGVAGNNGLPPNRCAANCTSTATCGDGFIDGGRGEVCDNGAANNDTTYNGCKTNCQRGPRCGDGTRNGPEACDDGTNNGTYGGCMAGCLQRAPYCGDGTPNGSEQCDDGTNNGSYGTCNPDCTRAARCGDAQLDLGREQCDLGTANNTGAYGTCNANCTLPAYCGDGTVNGAEACDDGVNSGAYNTCNANCTFPARCGDVIVQTTYGEQCDDGVNDATYDGCRANCHWAPYCGDGAIQTQAGGEQCDSGILGGRTCSDLDGDGRTGEPGDFDGGTLACVNGTCQLNTAGCYRCGDGVRNGFEVCDGIGRCGTSADCGGLRCEDLGFPSTGGLACLADCTLDLSGCNVATCGNGILDSGEQCDMAELGTRKCNDLDGDGVTNEPGDFSGGLLACTTSCTLDTSGCYYCGDGVRNGTELCDGSDTGGATCISVNPGLYKGGTLSCNATCNGFDFSGCWLCTGCGDCDGQACADHHCGFCSKDSDCCAPLLCQPWGECALF